MRQINPAPSITILIVECVTVNSCVVITRGTELTLMCGNLRAYRFVLRILCEVRSYARIGV